MSTLYFNDQAVGGAGDSAWAYLANWWTDSDATIAAGALPDVGDDVVFLNSITSLGDNRVVNTFSSDTTSTAYFGATDYSLTTTNGCFFYDNSHNSGGTTVGNVTLYGNAYNNGAVTGTLAIRQPEATFGNLLYSKFDSTPNSYYGSPNIGGLILDFPEFESSSSSTEAMTSSSSSLSSLSSSSLSTEAMTSSSSSLSSLSSSSLSSQSLQPGTSSSSSQSSSSQSSNSSSSISSNSSSSRSSQSSSSNSSSSMRRTSSSSSQSSSSSTAARTTSSWSSVSSQSSSSSSRSSKSSYTHSSKSSVSSYTHSSQSGTSLSSYTHSSQSSRSSQSSQSSSSMSSLVSGGVTRLYLRDNNLTAPTLGKKSTALPVGEFKGNSGSAYEGLWLSDSPSNTISSRSIIGLPQVERQDLYISRFSTLPLVGQSIRSGSWTLKLSVFDSSAASQTKTAISLYVWRPSNNSVVGYIYDSANGLGSLWTNHSALNTVTFNGNAVSASNGDLLVLEVWATSQQGNPGTYSRTISFNTSQSYLEGAYVVITPDSSSSSSLSSNSSESSSMSSVSSSSSSSSYYDRWADRVFQDIVDVFFNHSVNIHDFSPEYQIILQDMYRFTGFSYPVFRDYSSSESSHGLFHLTPPIIKPMPSGPSSKIGCGRPKDPRRR